MCGIFGYNGAKGAPFKVKEGLKRLEYRGYDSWGVAALKNNRIDIYKRVGSIGEVNKIPLDEDSSIAIGHTRWATHGGVENKNAHPHLSSDGSFALAHNGIVENFQELKQDLQSKGYEFSTETDTEVIVKLVEEHSNKNIDFTEAVRKAFKDLKGRNTIILLDATKSRIYAVRNGSPLVVGIKDDEIFIASDTLSFSNETNQIIEVENNQMVEVNRGIKKLEVSNGDEVDYKIKKMNLEESRIDKEGHPHFMIKEIIEQKHTIRNATLYSYEELFPLINSIRQAEHVYTVGSGTAYFAASQIAYILRRESQLNVTEIKAYEISSYRDLFKKNDVIIAVSQSGETADTIEALEVAKQKDMTVASIVNMIGSTIGKMSDHLFLARSGPEICVAATKSFTAQVAWGYLVAYSLTNRFNRFQDKVDKLTTEIEKLFESGIVQDIGQLTKTLVKEEHFFVLGKGKNYNIALEGALKVKEISYKHFEGFASGELKHGVIALIEKGVPVFLIVSEDENKEDMLSTASEVKSRGAYTIGIARNNNDLFDYFIKMPNLKQLDPLINIIPFQILSYKLAVALELNPDKPRNLAKSVTVK